MIEIRESQIEDVLVSAPKLTCKILNLEEEPRLLARQMILPSGRLDLLYAYKTFLLLLELKIVPLHHTFIKQVLDYKTDLIKFQNDGSLIHSEIKTYLLCPTTSLANRDLANQNGVIYAEYNPEDVLKFFYENLKPIASLTEKKPIDIGIWNLHLLHDFLYFLEQTNNVKELQNLVGGSTKTLYNKIKFAHELRLINWTRNQTKIHLSELGFEYIKLRDAALPQRLSEGQANLLKDFVMKNPYESAVVLGIASVVEAIFTLAKNTYPVPMLQLIEYFTFHAGKYFDWQTPKAKLNGAKMYSNYATDLGLLGKSGESIFLTPEGFKFTLQMQLHKSLKLMDSVKIL
jgi:hypothetical protein